MQKRIRGVAESVQQVAEGLRHAPTKAERVLWTALRNKQVEGIKFRRQCPFGTYILDFCAPSHRLVIEVDGGIHTQQAEQDEARSAHLRAYGYTILRFRNEEVLYDLANVLNTIRNTITEQKAVNPLEP